MLYFLFFVVVFIFFGFVFQVFIDFISFVGKSTNENKLKGEISSHKMQINILLILEKLFRVEQLFWKQNYQLLIFQHPTSVKNYTELHT